MMKKGGKKGGISTKLIIMLVIAGVVLMMTGGFLGHAMDQIWKYPLGTDDPYDDDNDGVVDTDERKDLDKSQDWFEARRTWDRALENVGTFLFLIGITLLIIGLLLGGIMCNELPDMVRLGMIVAVGFMVFYWV